MFFCFIAFVEIHMNNYVLIFYAFYIRAYIHTYIHIYTHTRKPACLRKDLYTYTYIYTNTYTEKAILVIYMTEKKGIYRM